jgi:TetR/AcrR family transcriptional regulator, tetracycline repressor protein
MPTTARPARRPRGSLTRDQIVDAALQLADEEGLDSVSMPVLARRVASGVMTLYGYIENKDDLLDAIALRGLADLRLPQPLPHDPASLLIAWGQALRQTLIEHPSLPVIFLSRPVIGLGIFRGVEALLTALSRVGMPPATGARAIYAILIYTTGFAAWEAPRVRRQPESAYAAAWRQAFAGLDPANFPVTGSVLGELARVASVEQFETGLTALAAGLTPRLDVTPVPEPE